MLQNFEAPQFTEVELELEETEEALRMGRQDKFFRLQKEEYLKKISKPIEYLTHSAEELYERFKEFGFVVANEPHEKKIKQLCCYFANDERSSLDRTKGILLMGDIGNGKTSIMKFFQVNQLHGFKTEWMVDVVSDYKMHGEAGVKGFNLNFKTTANVYGFETYGFCLDDIGTEEIPARHYAESKNVFSEIIQARYNNISLVPFNSLHITTNKTPDELLELYGSRCYDRMKEMFNVVTFEHDSFRK